MKLKERSIVGRTIVFVEAALMTESGRVTESSPRLIFRLVYIGMGAARICYARVHLSFWKLTLRTKLEVEWFVVNGCPLRKSYYGCLVSIALERSRRPIKTSDKLLGASRCGLLYIL